MESKKLNILVLSWRGPKHPQAGGAEQVMHEHIKGWISAGHSVTLFVSCFRGGKRDETYDGVQIKRHGFQLLGVHTLAILWFTFGRHQKFDLIIDQFHGIPFFTPLYPTKAKKIAVIQEVAREIWLTNQLPKPFNWIIGYTGFIGEPLIFKLYKNIPFITGSSSAKEDLLKMSIPKKNISIIHHGVILDIPKPLPKKENVKTIIFLGALTKDKGIMDAIRAFSRLSELGEYKFWFVGKGEKIKKLEQVCKKCSISKQTIFWGFVSQKKKFELLARAHILINPSVLEGWGLVNIEANAVKTPVVAYKSQGLVDSVQHNTSGLIVSKNIPEKLAQDIHSLLNNKEKYQKLQSSALKWSKNFSWKKSRAQSLKLIQSL